MKHQRNMVKIEIEIKNINININIKKYKKILNIK
jgi:hypothetical protein